MAKRYSNTIKEAFGNKRARLDVQFATDVRINTNLPSLSRAMTTNYHEPTVALWEDDDDELILLASQIAQQVESGQPQTKLNETDITFDRFSREVDTSTQLSVKEVPRFTSDGDFEPQPGPSGVPPKSDTHRTAAELQIDYLKAELTKSRKECEALKKDYSEMTEKVHSKDGEVSTLRFQLEQIKQNKPKIHADKLRETEEARNALQLQVRKQDHLIKVLQSENAMKVGLERSSTYLQQNQEPKSEFFKLKLAPTSMLEELFSDVNLKAFQTNSTRTPRPDKRTSEYVVDLQNIISRLLQNRTPAEEEEALKKIQMIAIKGGLHLKNVSLDIEFEEMDPKTTISSELEDISEFAKAEPKMEANCDLFQVDELFPTELSCAGRRFLAMLAYATLHLPTLDILLEEVFIGCDEESDSIEEKISFTSILLEILHVMGYSKNLVKHYGFICAASFLLETLGDQITEKKEHWNFATDFFRNIVFCRPNNVILLYLTRFLSVISSKKSGLNFLQTLCEKSPSETFVADENVRIQKFSEKSCILQVYCTLLEPICVDKAPSWSDEYFGSVMKITLNTVIFFRKCFTQHPDWMTSLLGNTECCCYNKMASCLVVLIHFCLNQWLMEGRKNFEEIPKIAKEGIILLYFIFKCNFKESLLGDLRVKSRLQIIHSIINNHQRSLELDFNHQFALKTLDLQQIIIDSLSSQSEIINGLSVEMFLRDLKKNFF
ncbi:hypothetical protein DMENIID0001_097700 [Sergentomyia squamirostris]